MDGLKRISGMLGRVVLPAGFAFLLAMLMQGCSGGGGDNASPSPSQSNGPSPSQSNGPSPSQSNGPSPSQSSGAIEVQDLGTHSISNDGSVNLQVQVSSASSFMLIADGGTTTADIDIDSLSDPTGAVWVTPSFTDQDPIGRNKLQDIDTMASGIFPHTPHYSISDGTYPFRVRSFNASSNTHVTAIINHRTNPAGGTLGVNLIFCGIPDINASNALNNSQFQVLFQEFVRIYALSNINVEIAGLLDCDPADAGRLTFVNTANEELGDLVANSERINNQAMNFFFVQGFENQPGAIGRTAKIAGPAIIQGTRYSGVVTTTLDGPIGDLTEADLLIQGATMAHEGGHYFGLYHTTESFGAGATGTGFPAWELVDPINDTPACPVTNDVNHDGMVGAIECLNLDGRNLMFWLAEDGVVQDQLTEGQQFVLHRHPYLH